MCSARLSWKTARKSRLSSPETMAKSATAEPDSRSRGTVVEFLARRAATLARDTFMAQVCRRLRPGDAGHGRGEQRRQLVSGEGPQDRDQSRGHQGDQHPSRDIAAFRAAFRAAFAPPESADETCDEG